MCPRQSTIVCGRVGVVWSPAATHVLMVTGQPQYEWPNIFYLSKYFPLAVCSSSSSHNTLQEERNPWRGARWMHSQEEEVIIKIKFAATEIYDGELSAR